MTSYTCTIRTESHREPKIIEADGFGSIEIINNADASLGTPLIINDVIIVGPLKSFKIINEPYVKIISDIKVTGDGTSGYPPLYTVIKYYYQSVTR